MSGEFNTDYALSERKIRVAIAPECNLHCSYCDQGLQRDSNRTGAMEDFRSTEVHDGSISVDEYIRSMGALRELGYSGVTFTGGEPMLNPHWPELVKGAKGLGFNNVRLTTNGLLINTFLKRHGKFPDELDLLTVSLDTFDDSEFVRITGGHVTKVIEGIKNVSLTNPELPIKANKVVMRSNLSGLQDYIRICEETGVIKQLTLLNLVCKDPLSEDERTFFSQQFVPPREIMENLPYDFSIDAKHEYIATTESGIIINLMDTTKTLRSEMCESCPIYCQEGFFTTRIATDGTIRTCGDFYNKLPYVKSIDYDDAELLERASELVEPSRQVELVNTLGSFCVKYGLTPQRIT